MNKLANYLKNVFLILGVTAVSSGIPASAVTLTSSDLGKTFEVEWLLPVGVNDNDGGATSSIDLSAEASFTLTKYRINPDRRDRIALDVMFSNTTTLGNGVTEAGITSFGFSVDPDAVYARINPNIDVDTDIDRFNSAEVQNNNQNFPGGFKDIDVCIFTQGCKGGSQKRALAAGESDTFSLDIYGEFSDGVTFSQFPIKFQTTENSFEFAGIENVPEDSIAEVPEPGMIVALGLFTASCIMLKKNR